MIVNQKRVLNAVKYLVQENGRHYFSAEMVAKISGVDISKLWSGNWEDDLIFMQLSDMGYLVINRSDGSVALDSTVLC